MMSDEWKPTTIEDWRKMAMGHWHCYEEEKQDHEATKNRLEMTEEHRDAHERVLIRLLDHIVRASMPADTTDSLIMKTVLIKLHRMVDDEMYSQEESQ
jgi:hypothetical protein